jgi:hypothetical protein
MDLSGTPKAAVKLGHYPTGRRWRGASREQQRMVSIRRGTFDTELYTFEFNKKYTPPPGRCWKTPIEGMQRLAIARDCEHSPVSFCANRLSGVG